ncbi:MAG: ABC transporter permease [Clostridium sp.]
MFYLKDILYGIKARKKTNILIIVQLAFTLFISYSILQIYFSGAILSSNNKWAFNDIDNIFLINGDSNAVIGNNELYMKSIEKVKEKKLGTIGFYCSTYISLNNIFDENSRVVGLNVSKDYYDMLNKNLISGKGFSLDDFELTSKDVIPIILGKDYKSKCNINDIVEDNNSRQKYLVVGFFKSNKYLAESNYELTMNINLKNSFIIPMNETEVMNTNDAIIKFNNNKDSNIKIDNIIFKNMKETIKSDVNNFFNSNKQWLPFLIISIIVALIGIIISTILSIISRKREFGIRMVLGESRNRILLKVTIENIILSILASIFATLFTYIININFIKATSSTTLESIIFIKFNMQFFIPIIFIIIMIIFTTSFILFEITKKVEPKELIGGID